jgi:hypothetical protein
LLLGGMRATRSSSMRFTEQQGRMEEPPVRPRFSTRSSAPPPYNLRYSKYGFIIKTEEEDEEKLTRLEKRFVANVNLVVSVFVQMLLILIVGEIKKGHLGLGSQIVRHIHFSCQGVSWR